MISSLAASSMIKMMTVAKRLSGASPEPQRYREWTQPRPPHRRARAQVGRAPSGSEKLGTSGLHAALLGIAGTSGENINTPTWVGFLKSSQEAAQVSVTVSPKTGI